MASAQEIGSKFIEAFNAHDESRIRELYGETVVFDGPGDVRLQGGDAVHRYSLGWMAAFPDVFLSVHNELVAGDWVVQEATFEGTHEGTLSSPGGDIPATHNRVSGRFVQICKVEGDVLTDIRLYFDQVQLMTQLGVMPEPAAAS
jgi:predicted ester cyclase